jgi:hypothetical protein
VRLWGNVPARNPGFKGRERLLEAILQDRLPSLADDDADRIADAVGDLALAVAQAAGYVTEAGLPAREYVALLEDRTVTSPARAGSLVRVTSQLSTPLMCSRCGSMPSGTSKPRGSCLITPSAGPVRSSARTTP